MGPKKIRSRLKSLTHDLDVFCACRCWQNSSMIVVSGKRLVTSSSPSVSSYSIFFFWSRAIRSFFVCSGF